MLFFKLKPLYLVVISPVSLTELKSIIESSALDDAPLTLNIPAPVPTSTPVSSTLKLTSSLTVVASLNS